MVFILKIHRCGSGQSRDTQNMNVTSQKDMNVNGQNDQIQTKKACNVNLNIYFSVSQVTSRGQMLGPSLPLRPKSAYSDSFKVEWTKAPSCCLMAEILRSKVMKMAILWDPQLSATSR